MGKVINLEEERRKRRRMLTTCSLCRRNFLTHEVQLLDDEAEVFILCRSCREELTKAPLQKCPNCGRAVYFLYPMHGENDSSVCAVCHAHASEGGGGREGGSGADAPC